MPVPDRPVDAAEIETAWGQEVHDYTFAPAGCEVRGGASSSVDTTNESLNLDTVTEDPGGFLDAANDRVEVPTDRGGLYSVFVKVNTVNGSSGSGFATRAHLLVNGTIVSSGTNENAAGVSVIVPVTWVGVLSAGDLLTVQAQRRGAGTDPDVQVVSLLMYRVGAELGA